MKKRKRFRRGGAKRVSRRDTLSKTARELYEGGGLDTWSETLPPRESVAAPAEDAPDEATTATGPTTGPTSEGTVVSLASGLAWVEGEDQESGEEPLRCVLPSAIAREQQHSIAVGDRAVLAPHGDEHRVVEVLERSTYLARPDPLNPRTKRVVAANVDLVVHLASVVLPPLRPALVDRYLIAIQQGGADALLCVNKIDLLPEGERAEALRPLEGYRGMLPIILCSAQTGEGLGELRRHLAGTTAVVVGHSGVGKSSLINALDPSIDATTGEVSRALGVGRHTTTSSNLYHLAGDVRLIDTPGIREFGLLDLDAQSLAAYFPDFEELSLGCRFRDCTHSHEPRCAVRAAVEAGELPAARHETYLRILASLEDN